MFIDLWNSLHVSLGGFQHSVEGKSLVRLITACQGKQRQGSQMASQHSQTLPSPSTSSQCHPRGIVYLAVNAAWRSFLRSTGGRSTCLLIRSINLSPGVKGPGSCLDATAIWSRTVMAQGVSVGLDDPFVDPVCGVAQNFKARDRRFSTCPLPSVPFIAGPDF